MTEQPAPPPPAEPAKSPQASMKKGRGRGWQGKKGSYKTQGRSFWDDEALRKSFLGYLEEGNSIRRACLLTNIDESTYYRGLQRAQQPDTPPGFQQFFLMDVPRAQEARVALAQRNITKSVKSGDVKASMWVVNRYETGLQGPRVKVEHEVHGRVEQVVNVTETKRLEFAATVAGSPEVAAKLNDLLATLSRSKQAAIAQRNAAFRPPSAAKA